MPAEHPAGASRPAAWWVLGTSLAFELVVLTAGVAIFQRRDF